MARSARGPEPRPRRARSFDPSWGARAGAVGSTTRDLLLGAGEDLLGERLAEAVCVSGPARGDVRTVLDDEGRAVVGVGPPREQVDRSAEELLRVRERPLHLVLHVRRVGPVVVADLPARREVR